MSRSGYLHPERDPGVFRYDLPRYAHGDDGQLVMEPLRTEDLPEASSVRKAPPPRTTNVDARLLVTLALVTLLASTTYTATIFILVRYSAVPDSDNEMMTTEGSRTATVSYGTRQSVNITSDEPQSFVKTNSFATEIMDDASSSTE
ncbi:hypothetical protein MRX96_008008 [Rhipicephalus microplus]